jgi:hypothetical protein
MAQQPPPIHFEDIPLAQARTMGRGPRIAPELYHAFKDKIQSLDNIATRATLPEGTSPTTMKNRILRVAAALNMLVTIRRVPGGLLFWRSTDDDLTQAQRSRATTPHGAAKTKGTPRPTPTPIATEDRCGMALVHGDDDGRCYPRRGAAAGAVVGHAVT